MIPPNRIRVLVVDDSVVVRRLVTSGLSEDPSIEICGAAANGRIALQMIPQVNPDIVTLDVEMPEMDGLEAVRHIRRQYPKLPVIMFSTLTERGATATLDALANGASDYVTKPANVGSTTEGFKRIQSELLPKIKSLCPRAAPPRIQPPPQPLASAPPRPLAAARSTVRKISVIAIGCSTGGPNALAEVIPVLPANLAVPVVIVQHMPPVFTRILAERLTARSKIPVFEAKAGMPVEPGKAYLAPGDFHLVVARKGTQIIANLNQDPPENSCRPAVDVMFRSVANVWGGDVLAAVLTGMGNDGQRGCEELLREGAEILAQNEASSVVWGMPGAVVQAGLAHRVLPLSGIGSEMLSILARYGPQRTVPSTVLAKENSTSSPRL